jgi:hypothetical protein
MAFGLNFLMMEFHQRKNLRYQILSIPHLQQPLFFVLFCGMPVIPIKIQTYKYSHLGSDIPIGASNQLIIFSILI